ncbi:hypothetical protein LF945_001905 [Salmonella enterica]|jgi:hypothetical protein|nr:hypothetical protein [Salmonella enterica]
MNEQQVNELMVVLKALAASQLKQAEAINRLAQADETLVSLIAKTLVDEIDDELPLQTYLDGKPR